jgi:hypothetical protein
MIARVLIALLLLAGIRAEAAIELAKRSTSSSGQFIVYTNDPNIRSEVAIRAEDLKTAFLEALHAKDVWKTPIILNIGVPPPTMKRPPRTLLGVYEGDNGQSKIQIDVFDTGVLKEPEFDTQILGAILIECAYRSTALKAGRSFERPPAWLQQGLAERIRSLQEGSKTSLYASLLATGEPPRLADFLDTPFDRLDSTSKAIYRAQASALVEAVFALPDGRKGLCDYLSVPHRTPSQLSELVAALPSLGGNAEALGRKWVLAIARASAANRVNLLGERDTAKQLDDILLVKALPDPRHPEVASMSGPYAIPTIARSQNGRFILSQTESSLLQLSLRAHPLYKSLVDEYLSITRDLIAKPKRKLEKRIATAEEMRAGLARRTSESRDYLDWVETTKIKTESPELNTTIQDIDEIEEPPARNDAISNYLDTLSERGQ